MDLNGKRQVVLVNRLKKAFNSELWKPKLKQKPEKNAPRILANPHNTNGNPQDEFKIGPYPLVCTENSEARTEREPLVDHSPGTPDLTKPPTGTPI